jgi:hypothetical protein
MSVQIIKKILFYAGILVMLGVGMQERAFGWPPHHHHSSSHGSDSHTSNEEDRVQSSRSITTAKSDEPKVTKTALIKKGLDHGGDASIDSYRDSGDDGSSETPDGVVNSAYGDSDGSGSSDDAMYYAVTDEVATTDEEESE